MLAAPSTAEVLAERLSDAIADGSILSGAQLHQEQLAERYGVSRSPIREALRLLEARGLVTYYPNRGAVVASPSTDQAREALEIRRLLEPHLVRIVARNVTEADVAALRATAARVTAAVEANAWNALHRELHEQMYAFAVRPRMLGIVNDNRLRFSDRPDFATIADELRGSYARCDDDLLDALAARDPERAAAATERHLEVLAAGALERASGS